MSAATIYEWDLASPSFVPASPDGTGLAVPLKRDLKFNHATGRLVFTAGDLTLTTEGDAIRQSVNIRLLTFLGEWFLDESRGMPYFQQILVKTPDFGVIQDVVREQILGTLGITSLSSLITTFDPKTRALVIVWSAFADTTLLSGTVNLPV